MSFTEKTSVPGRQAASILELELDACTLSYGRSPCTATLGLQNFLIRSDEFDNATWDKTNLTVTADQDTHPILGGTIVDQLLETAVNAEHRLSDEYVSSDAAKTYTASFVVKGIGRDEYRLRVWNDTTVTDGFYIDFDTTNLTVLTTAQNSGDGEGISAKIIPLGTTGYFRLVVTGIPDTLGAATDGVRADLYILAPGSSYLGDITKGAYVCAGQLREGLFAGIYARTTTAIVDGMGTVDDVCYNTFGTCQDTPNYNKGASPTGVDIDYEIVNVATVVETPDSTYADIDPTYEVNMANLVDGDEYLLLVQTFMAHTASTGFNTNYVRMVDESGAEMTRSEYRYESPTTLAGLGMPYQYVNWFTANPGVGTGKLKMQAQQTSASGSVRTNGFRAFCLNLTQIGTANYVRARNTTPVTITGAGVWHVTETITLPSAGDWMIFTGVNCRGFNGGSNMPVRIRVDDTYNLMEAEHDIEDSTGDKVHARWALFEGAAGGEDITSEQMTSGGVNWSADATVLIAIKLDAFGEHFIITGDPDDPLDTDPYDALADTFAVTEPGNYIWFSSLVSDWDTTNSGTQVINVDVNGGGAAAYSGDHTYPTDFGNVTEHNKQIFPNAPVALFAGDSIDVALEMVASPTVSSVLTNAAVWGFKLNVPSTDPDRTLRFIDAEVERPVEAIEYYPSIRSVRYGATRIQPGGKFSVRGTVTVNLQDFTDNDGGVVDDYRSIRSYDPETRGTFFGKLKERHKYYVGRPMRVLEGYLDAPFSLANFRTREYIIENIAGPTADGKVTITGKDILALARDDRAKAPTASTWTLRAAMTSGQTTLLPQTGEAVDIAAGDKHVRVNDEIIEITSESPTDTLNVVRAQGGTTAAEHAIDDSIQECLTYEDEPVIDVIDALLQNFANIPAKFIPKSAWAVEEGASLTGYDMTTIISAPTGVTKLLQEICAITLIDLWYSDVDQEIKLKLQTPFTDVTTTWDDDDNFIMDSVKVKDLNDQRLSRALIYFGMRNFAEKLTEPENYNFVYFEIETDKEGANKYADEKIRTIFSRWFDGTNAVQVALTSQRLLDRFGITPVEITFDVDAKDVEELQTGEVFDAQTRVIQDVDGSPKTVRFQVVETKPKDVGSKYSYKSLAFFQDPTPDTLTIAADEVDYDIFVELGGPPAAVDVTVTVNTTINVDASNGSVAMTTAGMHPDSTLHLTNNGNIRGYGGNGGVGRGVHIDAEFESMCIEFNFKTPSGQAGQAGGDALNITIPTTIDNTSGNIWGGAGGGGGGDSYDFENVGYGGGGGGGGIGTATGNGGGGGPATAEGLNCFGTPIVNDGSAGVAGSTSAAGAGGAAGGAGAGAGGAGGADWGDDGSAGGSGGYAGGVGGYAVRLNGNSIAWEGGNNATQVKGDVA